MKSTNILKISFTEHTSQWSITISLTGKWFTGQDTGVKNQTSNMTSSTVIFYKVLKYMKQNL